MSIGYFSVLGRAWSRAKGVLFNPFNLDKWMAMGFTAWLATLAESSSGGGRALTSFNDDNGCSSFDDFSDWTCTASDFIRDFFSSGIEAAIFSALVLAGILIALLVNWLSSRGHFMFLDNVVHNRSRVREPWGRLGHLGDSLFLWRLVFGAAVTVFVVGAVLFGLISLVPLFIAGNGAAPGVVGGVGLVLFLIFMGLLTAFVEMLLYHFVVPLMYKYEVGVMDAWRRFMVLLRRETMYFVLYALFLLGMYILLGAAVVAFGLLTCCAGFLVMMVFAIPVLGAVLMLPFHVTWRFLGLEFMAQFGEDFDVLPRGTDVDDCPDDPAPPVLPEPQ